MVFFITFLRALAACLITNAHYSGIYPTDIIANGGLIGDILFFAVSGYCLYNVKLPFIKWYAKRLYRIYPPVLIVTALYMILGEYHLAEHSAFWWYIYPTCYHFVASIIVLYIPFYFAMKIEWLKTHIIPLMGMIAALYLVVYLSIYDKSYYHIDTVREPMIRFLFMESMLLGAWFRQNDANVRNRFKGRYLITMFVAFSLYFASKLLFSRREDFAQYQVLNQVLIFALLFLVFLTFAGLDSKLEKLPAVIKRLINFISRITLEIYVVQYVLIDFIRPIGHFPINWIVLTASIIAVATLLHKLCELIYAVLHAVQQKVSRISQGGRI